MVHSYLTLLTFDAVLLLSLCSFIHSFVYFFQELANPSVTPTVELNALAMKRGEQVAYQQVERPRQVFYPMPSYDFRGMGNQRWTTRDIFYSELTFSSFESITLSSLTCRENYCYGYSIVV